MSLDPHFASSVFGLITIAEMGLLALSVSTFAVIVGQPSEDGALRNLGRLIMALLILWAYLDFMQLLIVWQSDLPNEASMVRRALDRRMGRHGFIDRRRPFHPALFRPAVVARATIAIVHGLRHGAAHIGCDRPQLVAGRARIRASILAWSTYRRCSA